MKTDRLLFACPFLRKTAPKNGAVKFSVINQLTFALMYFAISS